VLSSSSRERLIEFCLLLALALMGFRKQAAGLSEVGPGQKANNDRLCVNVNLM
jgi:hypothetical protein